MEKYQLLLRFDREGYSIIRYNDKDLVFDIFISQIRNREDAVRTVAALNAAEK